MNDLYHCCRWCKWFEKGVCTNERVFDRLNDNVLHPFWENGNLSEAIREGLSGVEFKELEAALIESKLSKKRVAEIMKTFHDELDDAFVNWTENIDGCVSIALTNYDFGRDDGIPIKDPSNFHCKFFW